MKLSVNCLEKLFTAGLAALCCGAAHLVPGGQETTIFLSEAILGAAGFAVVFGHERGQAAERVLLHAARKMADESEGMIDGDAHGSPEARSQRQFAAEAFEEIAPRLFGNSDANSEAIYLAIANAGSDRKLFIEALLSRAGELRECFRRDDPGNQISVGLFQNIAGWAFDRLSKSPEVQPFVNAAVQAALARIVVKVDATHAVAFHIKEDTSALNLKLSQHSHEMKENFERLSVLMLSLPSAPTNLNFVKANALLHDGDLSGAKRLLHSMLGQSTREAALIYEQLGAIAELQGDEKIALDAYKKAIALGPCDLGRSLRLVRLHIARGERAEANRLLERIQQLD